MTMGCDELLEAARQVALAWNHHWLGTEHLLVAYLEAERQDKVKPFLTDAGLKHDAAVAGIQEAVPPASEPEQGKAGTIHTPRVHGICGFARGWAAAASWPDPPTVNAEHVMLAVLVDGEGVGAQAIKRAGVNVDNVVIHMGNRLASG